MNVAKRDEVPQLEGGHGEVIRELAGLARGNAWRLSLAEVTLEPGGRSLEHYHRLMEEVYYLLEGCAQLTVGDETQVVEAGDTIVIPPGTRHTIVNTGAGRVVMLVACAPPWNPEDNIFFE
jgi:mannose-6-phosphate isomerase-like protein (cupin superfamily)